MSEQERMQQQRDGSANWRKWGPYLSERAWGTVREDYSANGTAWEYFPHDQARSKAYRWNEDGLAGISDDNQYLCFALALWNGQDAILKERAFGLTGNEGNHGEDVKEIFFYLDNTPTHSYMKWAYKYPQAAFPYANLVEENRRRDKSQPEYELFDTGVFNDNRYFDVVVEYSKASTDEILIAISVTNRGDTAAELEVLPTLWFRNIWSWGKHTPCPQMQHAPEHETFEYSIVQATSVPLGTYYLACQRENLDPQLLFCENETNNQRLYNTPNANTYAKDGINDFVVNGQADAVNPAQSGTKCAVRYRLNLAAGETQTLRLCLSGEVPASGVLRASWETVFAARRKEADDFYETVAPEGATPDLKMVQRQALAGLLWSKQFYKYDVRRWLMGDPTEPTPPPERWHGRNHDWTHLNNHDIISMPDKWEYPWYAAWDLAFHTLAMSLVDSDFAKDQLILLLREWYMHPNGQLPAYEWAFGDVNPPVHAWAALRVYRIERKQRGQGDTNFLERVFHKLLINFTWWINRKDAEGRNIFQGGFLGLDNIGIFDRSAPLPNGARLDQADGTSWMAMYCLNMLAIALELAGVDKTYEDVATKFLEHFFYIAHAMNDRPAMATGDDGVDLWDEEDGFYYDVLHRSDGGNEFVRVRSLVGLIPLLAVETLDPALLNRLTGFRERMEWFMEHRPDLTKDAASVMSAGAGGRRLFSVVDESRLRRILNRVLDSDEFLSPYGLRSLSRFHLEHPVEISLEGTSHKADYEPAESTTQLFGGNSNWRGPIWFPLNYLLIEALQKFDFYYGNSFQIECPIGSGEPETLWNVSTDLSQRLISIFAQDDNGQRAVFGGNQTFQNDPNWRDMIPFHEYFHGDNGAGLGAAHQTGWTALVAKLIQQSGAQMNDGAGNDAANTDNDNSDNDNTDIGGNDNAGSVSNDDNAATKTLNNDLANDAAKGANNDAA